MQEVFLKGGYFETAEERIRNTLDSIRSASSPEMVRAITVVASGRAFQRSKTAPDPSDIHAALGLLCFLPWWPKDRLKQVAAREMREKLALQGFQFPVSSLPGSFLGSYSLFMLEQAYRWRDLPPFVHLRRPY